MGLAVLFLFSPSGQKFALKQAIKKVEADTGATFQWDDCSLNAFRGLSFDNLLILDQQSDTLVFAEDFKARVRDWDLLEENKLKPHWQLANIVGNDVRVNLYKVNDSTFNFDFLIDYLGNDSPKEKKEPKYQLDLEDISLNQVNVYFLDEFGGMIVDVQLEEISALFEKSDIPNKELVFANVSLESPDIFVQKAANLTATENGEKTDKFPEYFSAKKWAYYLNELHLNEGTLTYIQGDPRFTNDGTVDFKHLDIAPLNVDLSNLKMVKDTMEMDVSHFALTDVSGFEINEVQTHWLLTKKALELSDLSLETPNSKLGDYLKLRYKKLGDFRDFVNKVKLESKTQNALLSVRDIEYFVPVLAENNIANKLQHYENFAFSGNLKGKINNLRGDDLKLNAGGKTFFDGKFRLRGLPDVDNTFIDFKVNSLRTHVDEIVFFFPEVSRVNADIGSLEDINFSGTFTGFPNDFVADGTLLTDLGSVTTDINMKINDIARYSGDLTLKEFNLKRFLADERFGMASFSSKIKGQGLRIEELDASINGRIEAFEFKGYNYQDLVINGTFDRKLFNGVIKADDPNFDLNFSGAIDFNTEKPIFGFETEVFALDLKSLNLTEENYKISGKAKLDFEGNNIDNLVGTGVFDSLVLQKNDSTYLFKDLLLVSEIGEENRTLRLDSEYLTANFEGDFGFQELPNQLKRFVSIYFPYRFKQVAASDYPSVVNFDIDIHQPLTFLSLVDTNLTYVGAGDIDGFFNDQYRQLELDAALPRLIYKNMVFDTIAVKANSDVDKIETSAFVDHFDMDKVHLNAIDLTADIYRDTIDFLLKIEEDSAYNNVRFDGLVYTNSDTLRLKTENLELNIADKVWEAEGGDVVWLNKDYFSLDNLHLQNENHNFFIDSRTVNKAYNNETRINFESLEVEEVMQFLDRSSLGLAGTASGWFKIQNVFKGPIITGDTEIDSFAVRGKLLGNALVKAKKLPDMNRIAIDADINGNMGYALTGQGYFDPGTAKTDPKINLNLDIDTVQVGFLEAFVGENISGTTGFGSGKLRVHGPPNAPFLNGELLVQNTGTTIEYLKTHYEAPPATVKFKGKNVLFEDIELLDKYENVALLNGELFLNDFQNMHIDATISSNKFLFLDTRSRDNDLFYGEALASGYAAITGPFNDIDMYVYGRSLNGTRLHIPVSSDTQLNKDEVYTFININAEQEDKEQKEIDDRKMAVRLDLDITPDAEIQIIFDLQEGDIIRARGQGSIQMESKTNEDFKIYGDYTIDNGDYLFTLQNIFQKKFKLERGGELRFFGSPYQAQMDINAIYTAKNTNLSQLVETTDLTGTDSQEQNRVDTDVLLNLAGTLESPDISFQIKLPESNIAVLNTGARKIEQLNRDEDKSELSRQVFGLLVFNDFLPQQSLLGEGALQSSINTTVSEFVSNQVTSFLSQTLQDILGTNSDIALNWRRYDEETLDSQFDTRDEIELVFTQRLLNDKLIIDIGGNFDVSENNDENWNLFLSDFAVQYKMTDDGRYRLKLFSKTDWDFLQGEYYNRAGVSLYTSEEFDNLQDLWNTMKQRRVIRKKARREKKAAKAQKELDQSIDKLGISEE